MFLKKKKGVLFTALSLLLHVILLVGLFCFVQKKYKNQKTNISVEIKLKEEPLVKKEKKVSVSKISKSKLASTPKTGQIKLKNLLPGANFNSKDMFKHTQRQQELQKELVIEDLSFYQAVWARINSKFYYPDIFNILFLSGVVSTEIYVNQDGSLSRYIIDVKDANEDMEAFVKAILVEALHSPMHRDFWMKNKKDKTEEVRLILNFHLDMLKLAPPNSTYSEGHVNRRELFFYRRVFNPKANAVSRTLPFLGGGGMVDVVYIFNALSGRLKKIYKLNMKKLYKFRRDNRAAYNKKRH